MVKLIGIFAAITIVFLLKWGSADDAPIQVNQQELCQKLSEKVVTAFIGFPVALTYSDEMQIHLLRRSIGLREDTKITCKVSETATNRLVNSTTFPLIKDIYDNPMTVAYKIAEIMNDAPLRYRIECGYPPNSTKNVEVEEVKSLCLYYNINVTISNVPAVRECNETAVRLYEDSLRQGQRYRLSCFEPLHFEHSPEVRYRWFRQNDGECFSDFKKDVYVIDSSHALYFRNITLSDAGIYTCMAYHGDHKVILVRQNICVKYRYVRHLVSNADLSCNDKKVPLHGNGTIQCRVTLSISKSRPGYFFWYKIGSKNEQKTVCNETYSKDERRISCFEASSLEKDQCAPPTSTAKPPADVRTITLNIKNMKADEFGKYRLEYYVYGITVNGKIHSNVTIERDRSGHTSRLIIGITVAVFLALLLIGIIVMCLFMRMDILWLYKKYFGTIEKGTYPYMAYFVYHYEEGRHDGESMKKTNILVNNMHNFMNKFGGTVFDEYKDIPKEQCNGSNIVAVQKECQRIVLFLTPDFVTDHWSRFATYTAIESVIREGKKLILIIMPETRDAIKLIDDEPRRVLEMAIKRNTTIRWNGRVPFSNAFRRRLEYALPKRDKPRFNRFLSDSSQACLTQHTGSPSKCLIEMKRTDNKNGDKGGIFV